MELKPTSNNGQTSTPENEPNPSNGETHDPHFFYEDIDSNCSTPYVSAPSSPGRGPISGFFYSAPASPMHFVLSSASMNNHNSSCFDTSASEFEFSARFGSGGSSATGPMSSADELFLDGKIRPMKLSTHLEQPQAPLLDLQGVNEENGDEVFEFGPMRGRDLRFRDKSLRRRTRSMSPMRNMPFGCEIYGDNEISTDHSHFDKHPEHGELGKKEENGEEEEVESLETTPSVSASSSRSSSAGRNSKRWVFLKDFLHRSKSEGRSNNKFWATISFSGSGKEKKTMKSGSQNKEGLSLGPEPATQKAKAASGSASGKKPVAGKPANGVGKRRMVPSLHELHYTANRAQAEEMRKKTYLPYRQGLLGCLGFSSKGYGAAMSTGFARALNPVSSR